MTTEINYHALLERARNKVQSIEFALTQSAFAEIRAELEDDLELARIALASLEVEPDERAAYELFMEKRFGKTVDRRRAKTVITSTWRGIWLSAGSSGNNARA